MRQVAPWGITSYYLECFNSNGSSGKKRVTINVNINSNTTPIIPTSYQCNDGIDNDNDGLTDTNDPGCTSTTDNNEYNTSVQTDTTPPTISNIFPTTLPSGTTSTTLSLTTNESAVCKYSKTNISYTLMPNTFTGAATTNHTSTISGLVRGTNNYYVKCSDLSNNMATYDISFEVESTSTQTQIDTTPPIISNGFPKTILPSGTTWTILSVKTNERAYCKYSKTDRSYTSMSNFFSGMSTTNHKATVRGLVSGVNNYYVKCADLNSEKNISGTSYNINFRVESTPTSTITSISPKQGIGGDIITVYGTNLSNASSIEFYFNDAFKGRIMSGIIASSQNLTFAVGGKLVANSSPINQIRVVTPSGRSNAINFSLKVGSNLKPITITPIISTTFTRNFWRGIEGEDVRKLQQLLNSDSSTRIAISGIGSVGNESTYYGFLTQSAVQNFQCKYGIVCSGTPDSTGYGVVGPKTRTKLQEVSDSLGGIVTETSPSSSVDFTSPSDTQAIDELTEQINELLEMIAEIQAQLDTQSNH